MDHLNIAFVTRGLQFTGESLATGSLGGSETAALCMARALAKRGHRVQMFCECPREGTYDGVQYFHVDKFVPFTAHARWDVLIASRWMEFLQAPATVGWRVLWLHDTLVDRGRLMGSMWRCDELFMLSDFHIQNYTEQIPEIKDFIWKTRNGVDQQLIAANMRPKVTGKLIYVSRPERGLHMLLGAALKPILESNPEAKLYIANYSLQNMQVPPEMVQQWAATEAMAKQFGDRVVNLGHLTKAELYQHISSSELMLYPTAFPEISCIAALEAQACGTPIVSTNAFALKETVGPDCGRLIEGLPPDENYLTDFINAAKELLANDVLRTKMGQAGQAWISQGYDWDAVAASWEMHILDKLFDRWEGNKAKVIKQLAYVGDVAAATRIAANERIEIKLPEVVIEKPEASIDAVGEQFKKAIPRYEGTFDVAALGGVDWKNVNAVLDVACGPAAFALYLKKRLPQTAVLALDRSETSLDCLLAIATQAKLEIGAMIGDVTATIQPDEYDQFDVIHAGHIIEELEDPTATIQNLLKLLKPDGHLIMTTRCGAEQHRLQKTQNRWWNFDFYDFVSLFPEPGSFQSAFICPQMGALGAVGTWVVVIKKDAKVADIDWIRKCRVTRPYQSIAACMITKNEEDNIGRCLKAIRPVVDFIRVADTGSTDRTKELAAGLADEVFDVQFEDFGQVRNASIDGVTEDLILWLDADEVMSGFANLRKYAYNTIFEGFAIKQCHLMLDLHGTFDVPVRLFKNRPTYRFVGCIHEHAENTGPSPYDNQIMPTLLLPDVDLAHYGYLNERVRRNKCSNRNMRLLLKDLEKNPDRKLNKVLAIRDYINIVKWWSEVNGRVLPGSPYHKCLEAAVQTYLMYFADSKHRYDDLAFPMYQDALQLLGKMGLPFEDRKRPPFEVALITSGAFGGLQNKDIKPDCKWFIDDDQYMQYIKNLGSELMVRMEAGSPWKYKKEQSRRLSAPFKNRPDTELLRLGENVINLPHL